MSAVTAVVGPPPPSVDTSIDPLGEPEVSSVPIWGSVDSEDPREVVLGVVVKGGRGEEGVVKRLESSGINSYWCPWI